MKVTKVPSTKRNPAIDALWTYFPIVGRSLNTSIAAIMSIIITEERRGLGAVAVPDIIASTGPPPKKDETISASEEYTARWSMFASTPAMLPVILPKLMLAPILRH